MNAKKCQYVLFSKNKKANFELKLKLFDELIPKSKSIKFLGVTLDSTMSFNKCVEDVTNKCQNRINIIKILSHKSWKLSSNTLKKIYFSLVRSIIDYHSIINPQLI